jgi:iron complex outermembrane recepter protein
VTFVRMPRTAAAIALLALAGRAEAAQPVIETVVVTARRIQADLEREQALTPGGVTVLDMESMYERKVSNLADMLRFVPGLWSESSSGTDELFFSSRGSNLDATDYDKNGIKLLQDGLPVTTADGNNHNRVLDPLSAQYAVIARGANALTYGASTLGGAIDFITPTARSSAPLSVALQGGSHGLLSGRATAGAAGEALDGQIMLESKDWDGYRDHGAQARRGLYVNGGWRASERFDTRVIASWVDNDEMLPGALTQSEVEENPGQASDAATHGNFQKNVETWRLAAKSTFEIDADSSLEFGLSYEEQSLYHPIVDRILVDFDGPGPAPPVEVFSLLVDTDHRDSGAMLRYRLRRLGHDLLFGLNYGDGRAVGGNYRNLGGEHNGLSERVDNRSNSLEAFAVDRWRLREDWTLVYGAQFVQAHRDVRTIDAASGAVRNPKDDYSAVNPRLGVTHALNASVELYGSVSRLFEAPTAFEIENDVRGNGATLDPMTGTVAEFGLRSDSESGSGTRWRWEATAYFAAIQDEILSVDNPAAPGESLTTNIDDTVHAGIEAFVGTSFALAGDVAHRLEPQLSATWNHFRFDSDPAYGNHDLPAAPNYFVRGELIYRHASGFYAGPTFDFVGRRWADFANTYAVGPHELVGLRAGVARMRWEIFAEAQNLADEEFIATLGVLNRASPDARVLYPGAPRSLYFGGCVNF